MVHHVIFIWAVMGFFAGVSVTLFIISFQLYEPNRIYFWISAGIAILVLILDIRSTVGQRRYNESQRPDAGISPITYSKNRKKH